MCSDVVSLISKYLTVFIPDKNFLISAFSVFYGTVYFRVRHVCGCYCQWAHAASLRGLLSGLVCGEFELVRSLVNLDLPRPIEPLFVTVVFGSSGVFGFTKSINGASESSSGSITIARLCLDGDLINRPSDPRGTVPLLLVTWLNVSMCLLISFLVLLFHWV